MEPVPAPTTPHGEARPEPAPVPMPEPAPGPAAAPARAVSPVMRPQPGLFGGAGPSPSTVRRRPPRQPKNRALPAGIADPSSQVDTATRDKLLATAGLPRPVFIADLASLVEADALMAWQADAHTDPVRFLPAKARHRALGSLVVPDESLRSLTDGYANSWWGEMVDRYRGAKLFELGVLMRRVGESVLSHRLTDTTVLLRLTEARGVVGMVVVLDADLSEGSAARKQLADDIAELLRERLTMLIVATIHTDGFTGLGDVITAEAHRNHWKPSMPVAVARSYEWAANKGASAVMVLGG